MFCLARRVVRFGSNKGRRGLNSMFTMVAIALMAQLSIAGPLGEDTVVLVRPSVKTGDVRRYMSTVILSDPSPTSHTELKTVEKHSMTVKELKPDGSVKVIIKFEMMRSFFGGKEITALTLPSPITITYSLQGKTKWTVEGEGHDPRAATVAEIHEDIVGMQRVLPSTRVRVGEHWHFTEVQADPVQQGIAEFMGTGPGLNGDTYRIKLTSAGKVKISTDILHIDNQLVINRTTGEIVKYDQTRRGESAKEDMSACMTLVALGPDPKDDLNEEKK